MLNDIKNYFILKYIDLCIKNKKYELALNLLNTLVNEGYKPVEIFLKRGELCHKLLMNNDAIADFTYIINNFTQNTVAYNKRMILNYEMGNYFDTILDANKLLQIYPDNFEYKKYKFISYICTEQFELAKEFIYREFEYNKYKTLQFMFNEAAKCTAADELAKGLKILEVIDLIDPDNPLKIFYEANIYEIAGDNLKRKELMNKLASAFPKYFISHFRFTDMYAERDMLEISFLLELKVFDTQNSFAYPMSILEGYKYNMEGRITESKESFENAVMINPNKPEAYVLLAETLQLMSGYDNLNYKKDAEYNYTKAMEIYQRENLTEKAEEMKRQIKHLNSTLGFQ